MKFWMIAVGSTFIPLILLTRWAMSMQRGAGPQGGEILFLCYIGLWMWMFIASLATSVLYSSSLALSNAVRFALIPFGALVALVIFFSVVANILNTASLSDVTDTQSRIGNLAAFGLQAALLLANLWALRSRM